MIVTPIFSVKVTSWRKAPFVEKRTSAKRHERTFLAQSGHSPRHCGRHVLAGEMEVLLVG
jgi:hypothetical protein